MLHALALHDVVRLKEVVIACWKRCHARRQVTLLVTLAKACNGIQNDYVLPVQWRKAFQTV